MEDILPHQKLEWAVGELRTFSSLPIVLVYRSKNLSDEVYNLSKDEEYQNIKNKLISQSKDPEETAKVFANLENEIQQMSYKLEELGADIYDGYDVHEVLNDIANELESYYIQKYHKIV